jgi:hypothetical protein
LIKLIPKFFLFLRPGFVPPAVIPQQLSPSSAFSPSVNSPLPTDTKKSNSANQAYVTQLVRRELEKSLAQIEFPKPPQQDIYFLPNANNAEFLMCLGLEEVVKCVQEHLTYKQLKQEKQLEKEKEKEKQEKGGANGESEPNTTTVTSSSNVVEIKYDYPLFCAQCATDFTPVWRQDKNGVNLCEKCLKSIEKKQIKSEHNVKLKQAFLKAVKDKELFEKQLLAEQAQQQQQAAQFTPQPPAQRQQPPQQRVSNNSPHVNPSNLANNNRTGNNTSANSTPNAQKSNTSMQAAHKQQ